MTVFFFSEKVAHEQEKTGYIVYTRTEIGGDLITMTFGDITLLY